MNLISCNECAVVLDKDKLNFPRDIRKDDDTIDTRYGDYDQSTGRYDAYTKCPTCKAQIFEGYRK